MATSTKTRQSRVSNLVSSSSSGRRYKCKRSPMKFDFDKETQEALFKEMERDEAENNVTDGITNFKPWLETRQFVESLKNGNIPAEIEQKARSKVGCADNFLLLFRVPEKWLSEKYKEAVEEQKLERLLLLSRRTLETSQIELEALEHRHTRVLTEMSMISTELTRALFDSKKKDSSIALNAETLIPMLSMKLDSLELKKQELELQIQTLDMGIISVDRKIHDITTTKRFEPLSKAENDYFEFMDKIAVNRYVLNKQQQRVNNIYSDMNSDRKMEQTAFASASEERKNLLVQPRGETLSQKILKKYKEPIDGVKQRNEDEKIYIESSINGSQYDHNESDSSDPETDAGGIGIKIDDFKVIETKKQYIQPIEITKKIEIAS